MREEEFLQFFGSVLLIYGFANELVVREGLAISDLSPQGKLESVEMDVVKDGELCSEKIGSVGENSARSSMLDQD